MTDVKTITINGVGFATTITVEDGESLSDAITRAGLNPADLDVSADGAAVESPEDTSADSVDSVVATPKEAKLG